MIWPDATCRLKHTAFMSRTTLPPVIRISARSALISLLIALLAVIFGGLIRDAHFPLTMIKMGLLVVFLAASAVGVAALVLWVISSGVYVVFFEQEDGSANY